MDRCPKNSPIRTNRTPKAIDTELPNIRHKKTGFWIMLRVILERAVPELLDGFKPVKAYLHLIVI